MASASEDFFSEDKLSISGARLDFLDALPLADADLPNNGFDVGEEELIFKQAKMYSDLGDGYFSQQFCMKGLYPTVLTQPSPLNNRFYPVPVRNAQAMIELLLYSSLVKDDNNLLFPNPANPSWLLHRLKFKTLLTSTQAMSTRTSTRIYAPAPIKLYVGLSATLTK
jgi:hypothetical protein